MKANKQLNMSNKNPKAWIYEKETKTEALWVKVEAKIDFFFLKKTKNKRVSRLVHVHAWTTLRVHNQPYVRKQDYAHTNFYLETLET